MQQPVGGATVEGRILDVVTDNTGAFLVAAAEQIGAGAMVMVMMVIMMGVVVGVPWFSDMMVPDKALPGLA
jgi:hypothetical protein